jgi:hypothetical protein|nr:MAG TPA: hypothetical protein [Caudoviricetes sp.]
MKTQFEIRLERAKKEIEEDIETKLIPRTIDRFEDLHDYVDANYYGGLFDEDYEISENFEFENKLQTALNEWLLNGRQ